MRIADKLGSEGEEEGMSDDVSDNDEELGRQLDEAGGPVRSMDEEAENVCLSSDRHAGEGKRQGSIA